MFLESLRPRLVELHQGSRAGQVDLLSEGNGDSAVPDDDRVRRNGEREGEESDEGLAEEHD